MVIIDMQQKQNIKDGTKENASEWNQLSYIYQTGDEAAILKYSWVAGSKSVKANTTQTKNMFMVTAG